MFNTTQSYTPHRTIFEYNSLPNRLNHSNSMQDSHTCTPVTLPPHMPASFIIFVEQSECCASSDSRGECSCCVQLPTMGYRINTVACTVAGSYSDMWGSEGERTVYILLQNVLEIQTNGKEIACGRIHQLIRGTLLHGTRVRFNSHSDWCLKPSRGIARTRLNAFRESVDLVRRCMKTDPAPRVAPDAIELHVWAQSPRTTELCHEMCALGHLKNCNRPQWVPAFSSCLSSAKNSNHTSQHTSSTLGVTVAYYW